MGAITDVPGIRVGHVQRSGFHGPDGGDPNDGGVPNDSGWLTGVTVVLPPPGTVGSVDVRGGGPATSETDALDPTTLSQQVDAVVLTGGSAYGLVTARGAQRWCEENGRGLPVPGGLVPIVPAAAIFDLGRGGNFAARPDEEMGYAATAAAAAQPEGHDVERGSVGAGTGAVIGRGTYKGGVGTASVTLDNGVVVGALAIVNAVGMPFGSRGEPVEKYANADGESGILPKRAEPGSVRLSGGHDGRVPSSSLRGEGAGGEERASTPTVSAVAAETAEEPPLNTTLVVVATNAVLSKADCKRTASAAHAGLARALNPSHTLADGDTVFCLATGAVELESAGTPRPFSLIALQSAAADVVTEAILDGISRAAGITTPAGEFAAYGPVVRYHGPI
ncbi:P1 family peptidase [Arthrobacter oryzae]|uniref:P1 family peptidase n=1 Tax=Arthrobacter oryzae TaxID=409290 RepID=UPI00277EB437|nr:P1 family peptidase [Arthrobacter oryzae]MDQ0074990.1 L-aminopeptidase/D-esterase-like protein [Arthrobacter oryzae]